MSGIVPAGGVDGRAVYRCWMRISFKDIPPDISHTTWRDVSGGWLTLSPPNHPSLVIAPNGRIQVPNADLVKAWRLAAWIEGCELAGKLKVDEAEGSR